ncbi:hypothetical protein CLH_0408 [Clostridium botulinum E3 str. Alaska E43]|nr:hypothetical protein [Clostridium botulinum]ACD52791.1 hypothetical protein CLH_0408 [Clostridium botulinum E3 str. Alaska E43]
MNVKSDLNMRMKKLLDIIRRITYNDKGSSVKEFKSGFEGLKK